MNALLSLLAHPSLLSLLLPEVQEVKETTNGKPPPAESGFRWRFYGIVADPDHAVSRCVWLKVPILSEEESKAVETYTQLCEKQGGTNRPKAVPLDVPAPSPVQVFTGLETEPVASSSPYLPPLVPPVQALQVVPPQPPLASPETGKALPAVPTPIPTPKPPPPMREIDWAEATDPVIKDLNNQIQSLYNKMAGMSGGNLDPVITAISNLEKKRTERAVAIATGSKQ